MSKLPDTNDSSARDDHASSPSGTPNVFLTMADTTWRMFIPTIGLLLVGRYFDRQFGTHPWLMLAGSLVGAVIAGLLIKRQLTGGY